MLRRVALLTLVANALLIGAGCTFMPGATLRDGLLPFAATDPTDAESAAEKPRVVRTVLLYIPNRLLDLTDIVSLYVAGPLLPHLTTGYPLHVNARVTRAAQVGFGITENTVCLGKRYKHHLIPWVKSTQEVSLGPLTSCRFIPASGNERIEFAKVGILTPADKPFAEGLMDYWSVGAEAALLPVGAGAEVHPVEIVDFILGLFLVDVGKDDL